jgi:hemolysin D
MPKPISRSGSNSQEAGPTPLPYNNQGVLLQPPPLWTRILIWTLGLGTVSLLAWSWFTRVDETVSMDGQIETASPEAKVASANEGVIEKVLIKPHQTVQRGAPLFYLSIKDLDSTISGLRLKLKQLKKQRDLERSLYESKLSKLVIQSDLQRAILQRFANLATVGAAQEVQVMERQSALQETINSMTQIKEELAKSDNALAIQEVDTNNAIRELMNTRESMTITAPVTGTVHNMRFNAAGEQVQAGDEMATIVPNLRLLAGVSVPSRVSAPVKQGQAARLSVDAFPSNEFGELMGKIVSISPNTTVSEQVDAGSNYKAIIAIDRHQIPKQFPLAQLRPGMGVKAKVKLRDRTVISLVFDFLEKVTTPLTQQR